MTPLEYKIALTEFAGYLATILGMALLLLGLVFTVSAHWWTR